MYKWRSSAPSFSSGPRSAAFELAAAIALYPPLPPITMQAGGGAVRVKLSRGIEDAAFGGRDEAADMHHGADRAHPPGLGFERPHVVHLDLQRRVGAAERQHGVHRAAHAGIEQRGGKPAHDRVRSRRRVARPRAPRMAEHDRC